jgi:hypothetical protein
LYRDSQRAEELAGDERGLGPVGSEAVDADVEVRGEVGGCAAEEAEDAVFGGAWEG